MSEDHFPCLSISLKCILFIPNQKKIKIYLVFTVYFLYKRKTSVQCAALFLPSILIKILTKVFESVKISLPFLGIERTGSGSSLTQKNKDLITTLQLLHYIHKSIKKVSEQIPELFQMKLHKAYLQCHILHSQLYPIAFL